MRYRLEFLSRVVRDYKKLDPPIQRMVAKALDRIAGDPDSGKPLDPPLKGLRSYRTSDYRIIYEIKRNVVTVLIVAIGHRREVYDKLRAILNR